MAFFVLILNNKDYKISNKATTFTIKIDSRDIGGRIKLGRDDDEVFADLVINDGNNYQYFGVEVDYSFKYEFLENIDVKYYNHNGKTLADFYDYHFNDDFILTISDYERNEHELDALESGQLVHTTKKVNDKKYNFATEYTLAMTHDF